MVLIIGDSHTRVLALGQETLSDKKPATKYKLAMLGIGRTFLRSFSKTSDGGVTFHSPKMQERLFKTSGKSCLTTQDGQVFVSLGFHGVYFYNSAVWKSFTLLPDENDRHFLSLAAFDLMVLRFNFHILKFLSSLQEIGLTPVVISAPNLPENFLENSKIDCVSAAELQLVEVQYRSAFERALSRRKIPWLMPPKSALQGGHLDRRYVRNDDPHEYHGNEAYGGLVLRQIDSYLHSKSTIAND
jgi:hypothetical protein